MINTISQLNDNFSALNAELVKGKIISTSLKAESKPSRFKMIILSIFTLGWYFQNYKSQHNPERVFTSIKQELINAIQGYKLNIKKNDDLEIRTVEELKQENEKLNIIKENLKEKGENAEYGKLILKISEAEDGLHFGNSTPAFLAVGQDGTNYKLSSEKFYQDLIREKMPNSEILKRSAIESGIKKLKEMKNRSIIDGNCLEMLESTKINEFKFEGFFNFKNKKFHWVLSKGSFILYGDHLLPIVTNGEIIKKIDSAITSNEEKLKDLSEFRKKLDEYQKEENKNVQNVMNQIYDIMTTIWKKTKNPDKTDQCVELRELMEIQSNFTEKIADQGVLIEKSWTMRV